MRRKKVPHIKKICILFGVALCVSATSAFSFPSLQDIRQDIHEKLENLWAQTPAAKELAAWEKARVEAENALKEATINNASTYAHESLFEAQNLLARANTYAADRAYYKAAYLANKAQNKAIAAKELAQKTRQEKLDAAKTELDAIGLSIAQLCEKYKKTNRKIPYAYNELILTWRDLTHALAIEQLQDIAQNIPSIQKKIDALNAKLDTTEKVISKKDHLKK